MAVRALLLLILLTGCAGSVVNDEIVTMESNYITFNHPFTDASAESIRKKAEVLCGKRKQVAIKTASVCSLTKCTTNYQCLSPADAAIYNR
jgi:hypothetical protein